MGRGQHRWIVFCIAALVVASQAAPAMADDKGSCATVADVGSKVWKVAGPAVKGTLTSAGPAGVTAEKAIKLIESGIKLWNKIASDKTWARIGPRRLDFDEWNEGTLIGPTERMFISSIPALNPVTVDFHKLDFDGKVTIVVCKVPEKGKAVTVKSFTVDNATKTGKVKSIKIDDAKGNIITVVLHGKSVGKKLKYKVRAKPIYPQEAPTTRKATGTRSQSTPVRSAPSSGTSVSGRR